jgi:hypothetical protein
MRRFTTATLTLLACLTLISATDAAEKCCSAKTKALFNGQNLEGWNVFVDADKTPDDLWSVQDGVLVCTGKPNGYIHTTEKFKNFKLVVEWRWPEEPGNSGVLVRIASEPISFLPKCVEAQLMHGNAGDLWGFYGFDIKGPEDRFKEVKDHEALGDFVGVGRAKDAEKKPGKWNRYEITVKSDRINVVMNGKKVNKAWGLAEIAGPVGLQSEGAPIEFRKVELTPLK